MERMVERAAALDVHKNQVTACVHVPDHEGKRSELRAEFSTMTAELLALRDWLLGLGVTHVAMEATGVYWKPVYYLLEDDFELWLVNAQHVKNVPGRKTDVGDASGCASCSGTGSCARALCRPSRSASCATSRVIASRWCGSARGRPTGCRSCSRTPTSSWAMSPQTCSGRRARRCFRRYARASQTQR